MIWIDRELFKLRLIGAAVAILNVGVTLALPSTPQLLAMQVGAYLCLYAISRRLDEIDAALAKVHDAVGLVAAYLGKGITAHGPVQGRYRECPVYAWVDLPERGGRFTYDGAAPQEANGAIELSRLRNDQVLLFPGLLYRREGA